MPCPAMSYPALSRASLPCHAVPCHAMPRMHLCMFARVCVLLAACLQRGCIARYHACIGPSDLAGQASLIGCSPTVTDSSEYQPATSCLTMIRYRIPNALRNTATAKHMTLHRQISGDTMSMMRTRTRMKRMMTIMTRVGTATRMYRHDVQTPRQQALQQGDVSSPLARRPAGRTTSETPPAGKGVLPPPFPRSRDRGGAARARRLRTPRRFPRAQFWWETRPEACDRHEPGRGEKRKPSQSRFARRRPLAAPSQARSQPRDRSRESAG